MGSTAERKADGSWQITETGTRSFKEAVKDPDELAGRGARKSGDDRWEGKVLRIRQVRLGMITDQDGKRHSVTKVQPVPARTESTTTVKMERGTLALRKTRSDEQIRQFVRDKIVPALQRRPERMANTRMLYKELGLERESGRTSTKLKPNLAMFEQLMGGGVSITTSDIFSKVFPDMFQVRVYSKNARIVKLISAQLPGRDTDPPEKNEVTDLTPDDLTRELFAKYTAGLKAHIQANNGELTLNKVGEWLRAQPDYEARLAEAALGKDGQATKIMQVLGFGLQGTGPGAKVTNPP